MWLNSSNSGFLGVFASDFIVFNNPFCHREGRYLCLKNIHLCVARDCNSVTSKKNNKANSSGGMLIVLGYSRPGDGGVNSWCIIHAITRQTETNGIFWHCMRLNVIQYLVHKVHRRVLRTAFVLSKVAWSNVNNTCRMWCPRLDPIYAWDQHLNG